MADVLRDTALFAILLTLGAYEIGLWLQRKTRSPLANPIAVAAALVISVLLLFKIPNADYQNGCEIFSWLLTPATVCFAVPLYEQLRLLRRNLWAIFAGVLAGTVVSLGGIALMCAAFGLDDTLTVSLLPKSITTAMGIALSEQMGGIPAITTAAIAVTGILGSIVGTAICRIFRIQHPIAQGVAFGTASHVVGTTKAAELSDLSGAVSSLSLVIAGILTAVICPFMQGLYTIAR